MAYYEIKNIKKNFDNLDVLKGIDLSIEKGEVVSIIGSSGSGKTTLLRCINFLEIASEGSMILDGLTLFDSTNLENLKGKDYRTERLNFGLVFQSFNLFPQYNVLDNISLAPTLLLNTELKELKKHLKSQKKSGKEIKEILNKHKDDCQKIIDEKALLLLEKVGLTDKKEAYPCMLSGGQCQRVAIARALALEPKILCFDEPTSALDPELTGEVLKVIKSLKEDNRTMIIVTHEMNFAKNVSDKVVFMSNGVITEQGTPQEIFDNPKTDTLKSFLSSINKKD